ncbi:MAG: hypothetical protein R3E01_36330 [Pirellulaceae bacterium]
MTNDSTESKTPQQVAGKLADDLRRLFNTEFTPRQVFRLMEAEGLLLSIADNRVQSSLPKISDCLAEIVGTLDDNKTYTVSSESNGAVSFSTRDMAEALSSVVWEAAQHGLTAEGTGRMLTRGRARTV